MDDKIHKREALKSNSKLEEHEYYRESKLNKQIINLKAKLRDIV